MAISRRRQAEQGLQQPLDMGRLEEVVAADHLGHALQGVVDHDRQVIGHADVLAPQHNVAADLRPGQDPAVFAGWTFPKFVEGQGVEPAQRPLGRVERQPPGIGLAGAEPPLLLVRRHGLAAEHLQRAPCGALSMASATSRRVRKQR